MSLEQPRHTREITFMQEMKDKGIDLVYEPRIFYLSSGSRYTPDFYDPKENKYYELISTRQRWQQCKDKLRLFQTDHPDINFEIILAYKKNKIHSHLLLTWLKENNISKHELASKLGITRNYVDIIIACKQLPGRDLCFRIKEATNGKITPEILKDTYDEFKSAA